MGVVGNRDQFRVLCENSDFPHREEILKVLDSEELALSVTDSNGVPSRSMLEVYRRRLRIGEEKARNTKQAQSILNDSRFFLAGLENIGEDRIRLWHLEQDEASRFSVFESENKNKVVGCIYGVDRRKVTTEEWDSLWNGE